MIRVVAFDTSTWWGGVALLERRAPGPTSVAAEAGLLTTGSHAAHLLALLAALLAEAGWARSAVDAYVATRGPGSFTGIRVGLGTVLGLGLASSRPRLGVSTLEALAEAAGPCAAERVPLLDAGRGEVYGARYDAASSPPREIVPPWVGPPERAAEGGSGAAAVFGSGADAHAARLAASGLAPAVRRLPLPVATGAGRLGLHRLDAGAVDGDGLSPLYLRPADAELHGRRD